MTTLYGRACPATPLAEALERAGFTEATALLCSPQDFRVTRFSQGRCRTHTGASAPLDTVFEARVFDGRRELRWLTFAGQDTHCVLLSEEPDALPTEFGNPLPELHAHQTLPAHYLLWGTPTPKPIRTPDGDWTTLRTPRIGSLHVPAPPPPDGQRLRLAAREYVCVEPRHGNAHVAEERLLRIEPAEPPDPAAAARPALGGEHDD